MAQSDSQRSRPARACSPASSLTLRRQRLRREHGYLLARCSDGNFVFEPEARFDDGNLARGLLAQGCNTAR